MPLTAITAYLDRLPARMAEVKLLMADVVILPHVKKGTQETMIGSWQKVLEISSGPQVVKPPSPGKLKLMGIGVRTNGR